MRAKTKKITKINKIKKKLPRQKESSMTDAELAKLSVKELKDLLSRIESAIAARQLEERSVLRERFREMAEQAGLSLNEIVGGARGGKGGKVAAKFANPANPEETWTGRGRPPRWLAAKLKEGAKLDDFRL